MTKFLLTLKLFALIALGLIDRASAQIPDLEQMTLDFRNVSSEHVVQTVAESPSGNEKEVEFGDYDNDGDIDVVIAIAEGDFGQRRNKLYRNDMGVLQEVSGTKVIPEFALTDTSRSVFFRDFDDDGFLDLVVINEANSGTGSPTSPGRTKYFRNVNGEVFVNETERLNGFNASAGNGVAADFNNDGLCDIVIVAHPNLSQDRLAINDNDGIGAGFFADVTDTNMAAELEYGVHGEAADMNGDGFLDLLISNATLRDSFIRYNNNGTGSSGPGDFLYPGPGAFTSFGQIGGLDERTLVPGDFNNDGLMDFYFADEGLTGPGLRADAVYINLGNDVDNKAVFQPQAFSPNQDSETMKIDIRDLDNDGRVDLVIMSEFNRPYIYRNTSENGAVSFIEWTPPAIDDTHEGWHAKSAKLLGSDRNDLLIGADVDDHLFENINSVVFELDKLGDGFLPTFHDERPISLVGDVAIDSPVRFRSCDLPMGAHVSVLLRSLGDTRLTVSQNDRILASSDRRGHSSDQYVQFTVEAIGEIKFELAVDVLSFDGNGDGLVSLLDVAPFISCLVGASGNCEPFDVNDDGDINLLLVSPFVEAVASGRNSEKVVIEFLSRSN